MNAQEAAMRSDNSLCTYSIGKKIKARALPGVAKFTAVMAVLLFAGNAYATLIIDSFNVSYKAQPLFMFPAGANVTDFNTGLTSDIIGGSRDATLAYANGSSISFSTVNLSNSGTMDFAQGPGTGAKLTLIWDGDTTPGLNAYALGANLTSGGATAWVTDISNIDLDLSYKVEIYTNSSNASVYSGIFHGGVTGLQPIDFSQFIVLSGAGADFSNVGAIEFIIDGTNYPDADISINSISTGVPEPATFVLLLSGLLGLGFHVYRRRGK
ncbi:MAG: PEP-CTERM sorting domain-containing protein [Thermoguttaceae bacterium]